MKKHKAKNIIKQTTLLGIPLTFVLAQCAETNAMIKSTMNAAKATKPVVSFIKPVVPPKPKSNMQFNVGSLNKPKVNLGIPKGNVMQKTISFNNGVSSNGRPVGPVLEKISQLNLQSEHVTPQINSKYSKVNLAIGDLKMNGADINKNTSGKKLNLGSDFKSKLDSILNNNGGTSPNFGRKNQNQVGKLNLSDDSKQKLQGIFGNGSQSGTKPVISTTQNVNPQNNLQNAPQNIPPAPPLPGANTNAQIPDAPPLPQPKPQSSPQLTLNNKPVANQNDKNFGNVLNELKSKFKPIE